MHNTRKCFYSAYLHRQIVKYLEQHSFLKRNYNKNYFISYTCILSAAILSRSNSCCCGTKTICLSYFAEAVKQKQTQPTQPFLNATFKSN